MVYPVLCESETVRDGLTSHLEANGIETRQMVPLTNQPYLKRLMGADLEDRYPNAKKINQTGFYVGCYPGIETEPIIEAFHSFFN